MQWYGYPQDANAPKDNCIFSELKCVEMCFAALANRKGGCYLQQSQAWFTVKITIFCFCSLMLLEASEHQILRNSADQLFITCQLWAVSPEKPSLSKSNNHLCMLQGTLLPPLCCRSRLTAQRKQGHSSVNLPPKSETKSCWILQLCIICAMSWFCYL